MSIIERYIKARKALKITQGEIAGAIGVTQSALSQQEGLGNPNINALEYISKTYNIDMNWVFTGEGEMIKRKVLGNMKELEERIIELQGKNEAYQDEVLTLYREKAELERALKRKSG